MSALQGATEYRDAWRGLRMLVPAGWQVRRSEVGLTLHDPAVRRLLTVQPRPCARTLGELEEALAAWLRRLDTRANLLPGPRDSETTLVVSVKLETAPAGEIAGVFALQHGPAGGLISGYLMPNPARAEDARVAEAVLASLASASAVPRRLWQEEAEGAGTAVVPEGWQPEGRIDRANPAGVGAVSFQAWAGPATGVAAGGQGRMFMEPGLLTGLMGSLSGGLVSQGRYVDAAGYVRAHLLPSLMREFGEVEIEAITPRPELTVQAAAHEAAASGLSLAEILRGEPSGADVLLTFRINGAPVRQVSRVVTLRVPPLMGRGLPMWMAMQPYSYRAPVAEWADREPVLEGIAHAFRVSPDWQHAEQERVRRAFAGRLPNVRHQALDPDALLQEAEGLVCAHGARLGWHERPFCLGRAEVAQKEALSVAPELYEQCVWRTGIPG